METLFPAQLKKPYATISRNSYEKLCESLTMDEIMDLPFYFTLKEEDKCPLG